MTPLGTVQLHEPVPLNCTTLCTPTCVVFAQHPSETVKELDVALVRPPDVADSVRPLPGGVALRSVNIATPFTEFTVLVPANVPELMLRVMDAVDVVTVLPCVSCTVTTG